LNYTYGMRKNIVIFDVDGTLANVQHRVHHVEHEDRADRNWAAFNDEMVNDTTLEATCAIMRMFWSTGKHEIRVCTGRSEQFRAYTEQWLFWNDLPYHSLHMRPDKDQRADIMVKSEMLSEEDALRVVGIFEDRQAVVDMWRDRGLLVYQVAAGNF